MAESNDEKERNEHDLSNIEAMRNFLTTEEYPEGPYGSPINKDQPVKNKSGPWHEGQRKYSAFNYENKTFHQQLPRQYPGAHPPHDDPNTDEEPPFTTTS